MVHMHILSKTDTFRTDGGCSHSNRLIDSFIIVDKISAVESKRPF